MSMWIIVPEASKDALEERRFAIAAKTIRESLLDPQIRERWALQARQLLDGRWAIPADVLEHPAYAAAVAELSAYPVEELTEAAFPVSVMLIPG